MTATPATTTEPTEPTEPPDGVAQISGADLYAALGSVVHAIALTDDRWGLNGVHIDLRLDGVDTTGRQTGWLTFTATDGHRLARASVACTAPLFMATVRRQLLSREGAKAIVDAAKKARGTAGLELEIRTDATLPQDQLALSIYGLDIATGAFVEGEFPDADDVIRPSSKAEIRVDRQALLQAVREVYKTIRATVKRAAKVANERLRAAIAAKKEAVGPYTAALKEAKAARKSAVEAAKAWRRSPRGAVKAARAATAGAIKEATAARDEATEVADAAIADVVAEVEQANNAAARPFVEIRPEGFEGGDGIDLVVRTRPQLWRILEERMLEEEPPDRYEAKATVAAEIDGDLTAFEGMGGRGLGLSMPYLIDTLKAAKVAGVTGQVKLGVQHPLAPVHVEAVRADEGTPAESFLGLIMPVRLD